MGDNSRSAAPDSFPRTGKGCTWRLTAHIWPHTLSATAAPSERHAASLQEAAVGSPAGTCGLRNRQHNSAAWLNYSQGSCYKGCTEQGALPQLMVNPRLSSLHLTHTSIWPSPGSQDCLPFYFVLTTGKETNESLPYFTPGVGKWAHEPNLANYLFL